MIGVRDGWRKDIWIEERELENVTTSTNRELSGGCNRGGAQYVDKDQAIRRRAMEWKLSCSRLED